MLECSAEACLCVLDFAWCIQKCPTSVNQTRICSAKATSKTSLWVNVHLTCPIHFSLHCSGVHNGSIRQSCVWNHSLSTVYSTVSYHYHFAVTTKCIVIPYVVNSYYPDIERDKLWTTYGLKPSTIYHHALGWCYSFCSWAHPIALHTNFPT